MNITRVIALSIVASAFGIGAAQAQSLDGASPPAEFPPGSFKGKQYVDSKGCAYIRAGVDSNVIWVPRVNRARRHLCGQKPTTVAGATRSPTQSSPAPQIITLPSAEQPSAPAQTRPARTVATTTAPTTPVPTKPQRPVPATSARTIVTPAPVTPPKPQSTAAVPAAQAPSQCANLTAISRQYSKEGARCGPQAESPVTYGTGSGIGPQSSLRLAPNTRVVPAHVYQSRRHSQALTPPNGYRSVWKDDRLNLHRAERGLKPAVITARAEVPNGYVLVPRDDNRLNTQRALRTAEGDAQTDLIWTRTVPRELVVLPLDRQVVNLPKNAVRSQAEVEDDLVLRLSTRSAPAAVASPRAPARQYVRAATFSDPVAAMTAARGLAAKGLSVRLGNVTRQGENYKVVLAGPFNGTSAAETALSNVRAAGYPGARLSK